MRRPPYGTSGLTGNTVRTESSPLLLGLLAEFQGRRRRQLGLASRAARPLKRYQRRRAEVVAYAVADAIEGFNGVTAARVRGHRTNVVGQPKPVAGVKLRQL